MILTRKVLDVFAKQIYGFFLTITTPMKNPIPITISPSALNILEKSTDSNPFIAALLLIGGQNYEEAANSIKDPLIIAALEVIRTESYSMHEKRSKAARASIDSRFPNPEAKSIIVPTIVPPKGYSDPKIGERRVAASLFLSVRYVMLARNYGFDETKIFFSTMAKNKRLTIDADMSVNEIISYSKCWRNFGRGSRFPECPEIHPAIMDIMDKATAEDRGILLSSHFDARVENEGEVSHSIINGGPLALEVLKKYDTIIKGHLASLYNDIIYKQK